MVIKEKLDGSKGDISVFEEKKLRFFFKMKFDLLKRSLKFGEIC